jgi:hypothetical protein
MGTPSAAETCRYLSPVIIFCICDTDVPLNCSLIANSATSTRTTQPKMTTPQLKGAGERWEKERTNVGAKMLVKVTGFSYDEVCRCGSHSA